MDGMNELIGKLSEARTKAQGCKDARNAALEEFQKSPAWVVPFTESQNADTVVDNLETEIKELALVQFKNDGDKHPHDKITIKIFKTFKVLDAEKVREWCAVNLAKALKPDLRMVEKYAGEFGDVPGTEKGEEARAQIATQL